MEIQDIKSMDVCIPRMEKSIKRETIFNIFRKLQLGYIERIIEIPLKNDQEYKRVIIKLKWNHTETTKSIQNRLRNNEPVNIIYELPWFWKLVLCNK